MMKFSEGVFGLSTAVLLASAAAGCNRSEAATTRDKPAANAPAAGAKVDTDDYSVELKPSGSYTKDKEGVIEVIIEAKGDKHINEQYPFKFTPKESDDVAYKGPTGKDGGSFDAKKAVLRVPFTPKKSGSVKVAGKVSLSVCSDKNCLMEKQELDREVSVGELPRPALVIRAPRGLSAPRVSTRRCGGSSGWRVPRPTSSRSFRR